MSSLPSRLCVYPSAAVITTSRLSRRSALAKVSFLAFRDSVNLLDLFKKRSTDFARVSRGDLCCLGLSERNRYSRAVFSDR